MALHVNPVDKREVRQRQFDVGELQIGTEWLSSDGRHQAQEKRGSDVPKKGVKYEDKQTLDSLSLEVMVVTEEGYEGRKQLLVRDDVNGRRWTNGGQQSLAKSFYFLNAFVHSSRRRQIYAVNLDPDFDGKFKFV